MANPHIVAGEICSTCGQCCGGTCNNSFASCRETCYPCCEDSVLFLGELDLPAKMPVAKQALTGKYGKFNPNAVDGLEVPIGITKHPVKTDVNGSLTNFANMLSFVAGCGEKVGVIFTAGEFRETELADGDLALTASLLAYPGFAKRVANGYIRIV